MAEYASYPFEVLVVHVPLLSLRSGSFAEISEAALGAEEHGPIAEEGSPGTGATTGPRQLVYPATLNKHIDVAVHLAAGRRTLALQLLLPFLLAGGPGMVDSGVNMCSISCCNLLGVAFLVISTHLVREQAYMYICLLYTSPSPRDA